MGEEKMVIVCMKNQVKIGNWSIKFYFSIY